MSPFQIWVRDDFCEDFREDSKVYLIESQAVGHCDGNHAQTELFKFTNTTKEGKILETTYRRTSTIQIEDNATL